MINFDCYRDTLLWWRDARTNLSTWNTRRHSHCLRETGKSDVTVMSPSLARTALSIALWRRI